MKQNINMYLLVFGVNHRVCVGVVVKFVFLIIFGRMFAYDLQILWVCASSGGNGSSGFMQFSSESLDSSVSFATVYSQLSSSWGCIESFLPAAK